MSINQVLVIPKPIIMKIQAPLQSLLAQAQDLVLSKGVKDKTSIRSLQMLLYCLGYGDQLKWASYRADGDYGGSTSLALASFQKANGLIGDGTELNTDCLTLLLERYAYLPLIRALNQAVNNHTYDAYLADNEAAHRNIQALAELAQITTANELPQAQEAKDMIVALQSLYGPHFLTAPFEGTSSEPSVSNESKRYVMQNEWFKAKLNKHKKGVWTMGGDTPLNYITYHKEDLVDSGLTDSDIRVITPVSANEGDLNAINTWDNCFMTFGMFQWTLGQGSAKGELPALLAKFKTAAADAFEQYFGRFGLDVSEDTSNTLGYLVLDGNKINTSAEKEKFRKGPTWAFRFWESGLDERMQAVQIQHAIDRISSFLFHDNYKVLDKYYIGDLITSEYGLCLILDHHVNRPGHLMSYRIGKKDILGQAMKKAALDNTKPRDWTTKEEEALIKAYLPLRYASSMTHSKERALKIKNYLDKGRLSAERFSYQSAPKVSATRGLDAVDPYELIPHEEYETKAGYVAPE